MASRKTAKFMPAQRIDQLVGKRLRLRRTMLGLSQERLAKANGVTFQQIQKYEKGSNGINAWHSYQFAQFLDVRVSYFFEDLETPSSTIDLQADNKLASDSASDREFLEIMKAYKRIKSPAMRKHVSNLIRSIAYSSID